MSPHRSPLVPLLSLAGLALAACTATQDRPADTTAAAPIGAGRTPAATAANTGAPSIAGANLVTVRTSDYAFDAPDTIPAGLTTIRLEAGGQELHHATLLRLDAGKTFDDLMQVLQQPGGGPPPVWIHEVGGPNPPRPGGTAETTQLLEPGSYAIICMIPSPDGTPHAAKGMVRRLVVVPAPGPAAAEPVADVTMRLDDYRFTLSAPLTAGQRLIRVENDAAQPHEVLLVRLAPGKTPLDVAAWAEKPEGPPPGEPLGGVAGMQKGTVAFFPANLTPGEYGLICFIPDAKDGKPHFVHGMVQQFRVQ
jgi:hypothetical protein